MTGSLKIPPQRLALRNQEARFAAKRVGSFTVIARFAPFVLAQVFSQCQRGVESKPPVPAGKNGDQLKHSSAYFMVF